MKQTKPRSTFHYTRAAASACALIVSLTPIACSEDDGDDGSGSDQGSTAPCPTAAPTASAMPAPTASNMPPPTPALPAGTFRACPRPESAYFDAGTSAWYVSCQGADVPNDGYVTKLSADASSVVTEKFVADLDEPKGIRINNGKLYVSDVSELVTANLSTGAKLATTTIIGLDPRVPENNSLNDVTVYLPTGNVYVSDNRNDIIYRFDADGGTPTLLFRGPELEGPNGLLIDTRDPLTPRVLVASLGPGLDPMRGVTAKLGAVLSIDLADLDDGNAQLDVTYVSQRIGNLDGIEFYGDDLLVSDFFAGRVFRLTPTAAVPAFGQGDAAIEKQSMARSADLGIDPVRGLVVVPETGSGNVVTLQLGAPD